MPPGHRPSTVAEFVKFCLVGSSGILLDTAVLVGLVELGGLDPRLAAAFAFLAAATWNDGFKRVWTFALAPDTTGARSYARFVPVSVGGFAVRLGVMHVLIEYAGMGDAPWYVVASVIGLAGGTVVTFAGSKDYAFTPAAPSPPDGAAAGGRGFEPSRAPTRRWIVVLLGACLAFYVVNNAIWLLYDASSPSYDQAAHAEFALRYMRLFEHPTRLSLRRLLEVTGYWPPLFHISSVPFTMALGFSASSVAAANFLFLPAVVVGTYGIGRRLFDERVGVGAVVLTLLYPMMYALSREILVDFALVGMVTLTLLLVLSSDGGLNPRRSWLLGVVAGFAMLTKWTAVTFALGPAIVWFAICLRRDRPAWGRAAISVGIALFVCALVALPWYVTSFHAFLQRAGVALGSDPAREGDPIRVVESLAWYWAAARNALILRLLLVPTIVGAAAFVFRNRAWRAWAFLAAWAVPAMVFFVLIPNKDGRFVVPLLPAVALTAAAGLQALPWRRVRALVWAFVVAAGVYQFYAISFAWPVPIAHFYAGPPYTKDWKIDEILTAIDTIDVARPVRVAVLPNEPDFEPNIFLLDADIRRLPLQIEGVGHVLEPIPALGRYDVIVSKSGSISPAYAADFRPQVRDALADWMQSANRAPRISLWRTWPLPDGSHAEVYVVSDR